MKTNSATTFYKSEPPVIEMVFADPTSNLAEFSPKRPASNAKEPNGLSRTLLTGPSLQPVINTAKNALGNAPERVAASVTHTIPAAIVGLPGLTLIERIALAKIAENPSSTNRGLANFLSLSSRGIEQLVSRLRKAGLVRITGKGRARRFVPLFPTEPHTECVQLEKKESHAKCGVPNAEIEVLKQGPPTRDVIEFSLGCIENCVDSGDYAAGRQHLDALRQGLQSDPQWAASGMAAITALENRLFAFEFGANLVRNLPPEKQRNVAVILGRASSEKLAELRQAVETGALTCSVRSLVLALHDSHSVPQPSSI